jgi:PAS domain S-box-containing protein
VATGEIQRDASLDVELPNGDRRSITGMAAPLFDDHGEVRGAVGAFIDITALRKAEEAREQSAARLRLALRAAHAAIWQSDLVSGPVYGPEVNEIFGYPTDRVLTPDEVRSRHLPGELERFRRVVYADLAREDRTEVEFRIRRLDGEVRWLLLRGELAPSVEGQPRTFVGVTMDITERKEAEERTKFLAREVDHRANNLLAVVQSVVQLSTAPTPEALKRVLLGRISALGRAHKLLSEARWRGADLRRLVTEELMAFTLGETARLSMTGQDVSLSPAIAQGLAMALHELATNASKYGALSSSTGRVDVSWSREGSALLTIRWIETGGPAVTPPTRQGLGGVMLSRALEGLKGETNMDWRPEGLVCEMSLPSEAVESEGLAD